MKVTNLLNEMRHPQKPDLELDGFKYWQEEEREEDNIKIWHTVRAPGGHTDHLDYSPYDHMSNDAFTKFVAFHKAHNRFPTREDVRGRGPITDEQLDHLVDTLKEDMQQTLMPAKSHESTVKRLTQQLLRTACKNFGEERELKAAKDMARDFHKRLVANIESEYEHMKLRDVKEHKLSLTEVTHTDEEEWHYDHTEDGGMSAICPNCGSHEVMEDVPPGHRIHAARLECQNCGNFSKWYGPDSHIAQRKLGGKGYE